MILGSGGREHALAWKLAGSERVNALWVAPGNGGTEALVRERGLAGGNVPLSADDIPALAAFAGEAGVDLTVVGPEHPLSVGLVDYFQARGLRAFGPTQAAAQLESSKAFAKAFMERHHIPTARFAVFDNYEKALAHLAEVDYPVVVKASGLAGGKGVLLPEDRGSAEKALSEMMVQRAFGDAGGQVVIEERLNGREVSLLALSDGEAVVPLVPAQDYKRALDGDQGPNTGGMGAYAPVPFVPPALVDDIQRTILGPTVNGLREEGIPYVGVLYAGLMLTADGPRVLEFNCRFGDPETQAILPLLESDLLEALEAALAGELRGYSPRWKKGAAVTVVLASRGYPAHYETGFPIRGLERTRGQEDVVVFHAGTRRCDGQLVTSGGRVLNVTGIGAGHKEARARAYAAVEKIHFDGMHFRGDIASIAVQEEQRGGA